MDLGLVSNHPYLIVGDTTQKVKIKHAKSNISCFRIIDNTL